jgi:hypothetical protein
MSCDSVCCVSTLAVYNHMGLTVAGLVLRVYYVSAVCLLWLSTTVWF